MTFLVADVKTRSGVEDSIDRAVELYGRLDILVNNVGGASNNAFIADLTDEAFEDGLLWNVWSTLWGMRRATSYMIPQNYGRIINMSSVEGKDGKAGNSTYVASKRAVMGLTRVGAKEVAPHGITVNALCPGLIETELVLAEAPSVAEAMGITYEELRAMFAAESAIDRVNTVEEVAAMALHLVSPAGQFMTGASLSVDGGTAQY